MPLHLHFSRCTHILYRLSLMDDPAWDRGAIARTVDLLGVLERCAALYEAVPAAVGLGIDGNDIYTRAGEVLRASVPMWRKALEESGAITGVTEVGQGDMVPMDFTADGWFTDVFPVFGTF